MEKPSSRIRDGKSGREREERRREREKLSTGMDLWGLYALGIITRQTTNMYFVSN